MLSIDYVSNQADIQVGERVMTSGQDGIFPGGFLVGYVQRSDKGANYRVVKVKPSVDFSHIDLVLVVLAKPAPDLTAAAASGRGVPAASAAGAASGRGRGQQ
jgi:rod shape-determining protein MreC